MESDKKDIVFDLRDSGTVTIPVERFEELVSCKTRLSILQEIRIREVESTSYKSVSEQDYLLGKPVMDAWQRKQKAERGGAHEQPDDHR